MQSLNNIFFFSISRHLMTHIFYSASRFDSENWWTSIFFSASSFGWDNWLFDIFFSRFVLSLVSLLFKYWITIFFQAAQFIKPCSMFSKYHSMNHYLPLSFSLRSVINIFQSASCFGRGSSRGFWFNILSTLYSSYHKSASVSPKIGRDLSLTTVQIW